MKRFNENYQVIESSRISYTMDLNKSYIQWLVQMTPLTWTTSEERVKSFLNKDSAQITVDLEILIGKKVINK